MPKFDVLSPDKISIKREGYFNSIPEAETALDLWIKRYEKQGYYSTRGQRIPLDQIWENCEIITIND